MDDDSRGQLERFYRVTWLCSGCGARHPFSVSVCHPCVDLKERITDEWKRDALTRA
jgi:hypothetical protein